MTTRNHTQQHRVDGEREQSSLTALVSRVRNPRLRRIVTQGLDHHGDAFAAFLLGTDALELHPPELLMAFDEAYQFTALSQAEAYELLAMKAGFTQGRFVQQLSISGTNVEYVPLMDADALREEVNARYRIIPYLSGWHVFDDTVIDEYQSR